MNYSYFGIRHPVVFVRALHLSTDSVTVNRGVLTKVTLC